MLYIAYISTKRPYTLNIFVYAHIRIIHEHLLTSNGSFPFRLLDKRLLCLATRKQTFDVRDTVTLKTMCSATKTS